MVLRRLLWAMTSICLVIALIAVPVVGDEPETVDASDIGRAVDDTDDPTLTATPSAPTTFPPPDPGLGVPADPGAPVPPRAGLYRYRTTGSEDGGTESTTKVEDLARGGDETRLLVTTTGAQLTSIHEVVWQADGVRTLRSTLTFGDRQAECDWDPDIVEAVYPLQVGATWTSDSRCAVSGITPAPIVLERAGTSKVVELRRIQVAGAAVDVWVIERTERLSGGGRAEEGSAVALFSPQHGIDVELRGTVSGREYSRQLVSLEPEPV